MPKEVTVTVSAWDIVQAKADSLPPYLQDDELTIERFHQRNKGKLSFEEARDILKKMVEEGILDRQERRRKGKGGSHVYVYIVKGKE